MKTIVTKSGLENLKIRLSKKIEILKNIRSEKAHAYSVSGDGWHDNPGWIQLGQQEEMIAQEVNLLQQSISNAIIIDTTKIDIESVQIGCIVEFTLFKNNTGITQQMNIVGTGESDVKNKKISFDSPMGKALLKMKIGEEKEVLLPIGKIKLKIEAISYE